MKKLASLTFLIIFVAGTASCSPTNSNPDGIQQGIEIGTILKNPDRFKDRRLVVSGEFKGWKGTCFSAPPVSRSDWMLQDGKDCIYVTGTIPTNMDPVNPHGEKVEINVTVGVDANGKAYLIK